MTTGRRRRTLVVCLLVLAGLVAAPRAIATFVDPATATSTFSTETLKPPTNPAIDHGPCSGLSGPSLTVSWTATTHKWADGYQVLRSTTSGGPYSAVGSPSGHSTTSYTDHDLMYDRTYHYVVRARAGNWRSVATAQVSKRTYTLCA